MVVIDTNVIIEHLRQHGSNSPLLKIDKDFPRERLTLSVVSIQELYEGKCTKIDEEVQYLMTTLAPLEILPYTFEVAQLAGEIARDLTSPIDLADAAIAATAIINEGKLITLNKKDFLGIKDLELL